MIKKVLRRYWILLFAAVYLAVLSVKLWGLISSDTILPGGDTSSHYLALEQFVAGLSRGTLSPYFNGWFGGEPLFQFYQPFAFMIMAGFYFALGKILSLALILRFFIFATLLIFPWAFYAFLKEFFDERTARWGLWLSFLWALYPKLISSLGAGAGAAIFYGLFVQVFAVSLLLWYLVFLKRLLEAEKPATSLWLKLSLAAAVIVVTHALTALAMGLISVIFLVYYRRRVLSASFWRPFIAASAVAFLLSAFWLVPFLRNFSYTSAERVDFRGYISSPLNPFLYFDLANLVEAPYDFDYAWLAAAAFFLIGLRTLLREKKSLLPLTFFIFFFTFNLDYVNQAILPEFPLHYYRLAAYELVFYLAIAAVGLAQVAAWAGEKKRWARFVVLLAALALSHYVWMYDLPGKSGGSFNIKPRLSGVPVDFTYEWRQDDFSLAAQGEQAVAFMRSSELPETPRRTLSDINIYSMVEQLGSIHYFNNALPRENGQSVIAGLFAESAWQIPFIWPATNAITGNNVTWGRVRDLYHNQYFNGQPVDNMVSRLRLFGINYIIMTSDALVGRFPKGLDGISALKNFGPISIYHLSGSRPLLYSFLSVPGLYIGDDAEKFREFALGWYSEAELLDRPVAWEQRRIGDLSETDLEPFAYLIVAADPRRLSERELSFLTESGKPLIFLHQGREGVTSVGGRPIRDIFDFRPVVSYGGSDQVVRQPNVAGLQRLRDFIIANATSSAGSISEIKADRFEDGAISFSARGPVIINLSYFPYWHRTDGGRVYPVTPGQMLVFADGTVNMEYGADAWAKFWSWVSALTLIGVISAFAAIRRKKA